MSLIWNVAIVNFALKKHIMWTMFSIIVHFTRLGSRVSHDLFNQYVLFFSKQCTYCKTNAIYT